MATEAIPIAADTRESLTVLEGATGRQYRFVMPGPAVTDEEMAAAEARVEALAAHSSLVVLSGSLPPNVPPRPLRVARRAPPVGRRARSSWTPRATRWAPAAAAGTLLLKPSVRELSTFAG